MSRSWVLVLAVVLGFSAAASAADFPLVVGQLRVEGNVTVMASKILEVVSFKSGATIEEGDLHAASQAIFDLGYFSDVIPSVAEDGGIVFRVTENPVVKSIAISGNVHQETTELFGITLFRSPIMRTDKIRRILRENGTRVDKVLNTVSFKKGLQAVIDAYDEKGYALIGMGRIVTGPNLEIEIVEGHVAENVVVGLQSVPEEVARSAITIPTEGCIQKSKVQEIVGKLRSQVYFSDVDLIPNPGPTDDSVILSWTLSERRLLEAPTDISAVELTGVSSFPLDLARAAVGPLPSSPVDNYQLLRALESLHDLYWRTGYSMVRYAVEAIENGRLLLRVEEGKIGQVTVTGNTLTKPYVIQKVLGARAGDVLNRIKLAVAYQRLMSLAYFDSVEVVPTWDGDRVHLAVAVTEAKSLGGLNGSLAYSPESGGLLGKMDVHYKNLLGTGQDITLAYSRGLLGDSTDTWSIGYSTVSYFQAFSRVGFDLYRKSEERAQEEEEQGADAAEEDGEEPTKTKYLTLGGQVAVSYPWANYTDLDLSYKHELVREGEGPTWEPLDSVTVGLSYNDVNNPSFPTLGSRRSISLEKAGGFAPGAEFASFRLAYSRFVPIHLDLPYLERDQVLAARVALRWGFDLPNSQWFEFGGTTTIRGAESGQTPRVAFANLEYRVSLVEGLTASLFFDGGLDLAGPLASGGKGSFGLSLGIEAAGVYIRLDAAWVLGPDASPVPTFGFGFGPMF